MTKHLYFISKALLFVVFSSRLSIGDPVDDIVQNIVVHEGTVNVTDLSMEQRNSIIQKLRVELTKPDTYGTTHSAINKALLSLNDDQTILELIQKYHSGDVRAEGDLIFAGRENVIAPLAADLSLSEDVVQAGGDDILFYPTRVRSAIVIMYCIGHSTEFPPETQAWAKNLKRPYKECRDLILQWWEHNKEAILAKRYQDATWLPLQNEETKMQNTSSPSAPSTIIKVASPLASAPQAQISTETGVPVWLYGIAILSSGLIFALWYRSRPK